jgi:hypothetical protein
MRKAMKQASSAAHWRWPPRERSVTQTGNIMNNSSQERRLESGFHQRSQCILLALNRKAWYHKNAQQQTPTPIVSRNPRLLSAHLKPPTLAPLLLFCTLNGLASAAAAGSVLNKVVKYNPRNRTIVCGSPLP